MRENGGYIFLWRKLRENKYLWPSTQPYSRAEAWIDLLCRAAWKDHERDFHGRMYQVKRSELVTSARELARDWKWSPNKVLRFLKNLTKTGTVVVQKPEQVSLRITVCNYDSYNDPRNSLGTVAEQSRNSRGTQEKKTTTTTTEKRTTLSGKDARLVLAFLNEKTERNFQPIDTNLKFISQRIRECKQQGINDPVGFCRKIVALKVREWRGDEKMESYLRPATLFNKTKFWQYAGEIR